ncbi:MAG: hypothetical protein R3B40_19975 [Polyangiales bacterium]|nr:hypothetical protein [Myxococcales bacterium]MCB9659385.1 hypothetical protein [Sandaracinaceae bacterium]
MTHFARKLEVLGIALGVWTLAAPTTSLAQTAFPIVVMDVRAETPPDGERAPLLPVDPTAVRVELARELRAFVVAPEAVEADEVAPVATVDVLVSSDNARVIVHRASPPNAAEETQELAFQGRLTHARLVGLVVALIGPSLDPTPHTGMDVSVNPYHDPSAGVARLEPIPARSAYAFYTPNPYRVAGTVRAQRATPMPLGQNPYR